MITKERLEELIEQGATIYFVYKGNVDWKEGIYKDDFILGETHLAICWGLQSHALNYQDIFETEEEAEWHKEFGCIERTERLELPTWEEFDGQKFVWFWDKDHKPCCLHYLNCNNMIFVNVDNKVIEIGELTKENYYEACKLVKSLFLGEING